MLFSGTVTTPCCRHWTHWGASMPTRHCGTSRRGRQVVHHVRCVANHQHHYVYMLIRGQWVCVR
jgi:hypothetical protein